MDINADNTQRLKTLKHKKLILINKKKQQTINLLSSIKTIDYEKAKLQNEVLLKRIEIRYKKLCKISNNTN